jgi:hypothetical protein
MRSFADFCETTSWEVDTPDGLVYSGTLCFPNNSSDAPIEEVASLILPPFFCLWRIEFSLQEEGLTYTSPDFASMAEDSWNLLTDDCKVPLALLDDVTVMHVIGETTRHTGADVERMHHIRSNRIPPAPTTMHACRALQTALSLQSR